MGGNVNTGRRGRKIKPRKEVEREREIIKHITVQTKNKIRI